jgi:hypothetical protein
MQTENKDYIVSDMASMAARFASWDALQGLLRHLLD